MRRTHDKLIRDRIPEILDAEGVRYEVETLDEAGFRRALARKLVEEAREAAAAADRPRFVEELADLFEVVDALLAADGIDEAEVRATQTRRREARGGFHRRLRLLATER